jgi:hypothetical protein
MGTLRERRDFIWRPHLLGNPRDMKKTALEMGCSLHRGPVGGTGFTGEFERDEGGLWEQSVSLSLGELCKGNLEGGLQYR